jgi:arsenite-transporting ATPase
MERLAAGLARRMFTIPWLTTPPIGFAALSALIRKPSAVAVTPP